MIFVRDPLNERAREIEALLVSLHRSQISTTKSIRPCVQLHTKEFRVFFFTWDEAGSTRGHRCLTDAVLSILLNPFSSLLEIRHGISKNMLVVYGNGRALFGGPLVSSRGKLRDELHFCLKNCRLALIQETFLPEDFWYVPLPVDQ